MASVRARSGSVCAAATYKEETAKTAKIAEKYRLSGLRALRGSFLVVVWLLEDRLAIYI